MVRRVAVVVGLGRLGRRCEGLGIRLVALRRSRRIAMWAEEAGEEVLSVVYLAGLFHDCSVLVEVVVESRCQRVGFGVCKW